MKKLYFMRHGLSEMNKQGLRSGLTNTPLTDEGRAGAKQAGKGAHNLSIDTIVASTLDRAFETAQIVASEINHPIENILTSPLLVERDFGALEGLPYTPENDTDDVENIETTEQIFARARQALDWVETLPGDTILIVAHGAIGRAIRHVANPDIPFVGHSHFPNTEIVELTR